jgi:hypothetical protein
MRTISKFFKKLTEIFASRYITGINDTVNFPTGTAGVVDTGGKFGEEGGPQISSANSKSANLQTYKTCNFCGPSTSVAICGFVICGPNIFCNLQVCDLRSLIFSQLGQTNQQPTLDCFAIKGGEKNKIFHSLCLMVEN